MRLWLLVAFLLLCATVQPFESRAEQIGSGSERPEPGLCEAPDLNQDITDCKKALEQKPGDRTLLRKLALLYSQSKDNFSAAKSLFEDLARTYDDTDALMDLAGCYIRSDFDETLRLCQKAERLNNGKIYTSATCKLGQAAARYEKGDLNEAIRLYQESLDSLSGRDAVLVPKLDLAGLGGAYYRLGDYKKSRAAYEELYRLDRDLFGEYDVECGWALLQVVYALYRDHNPELAKTCMERAVYVFRKSNVDRIISEYRSAHNGQIPEEVESRVKATLYGIKNGVIPPDPVASAKSKYASMLKLASDFKSPWKRQFKQVAAPGWVWMDPDVEPRALLICVHGLGLHHRAYESFAKRVAPSGIVTVAFDVRGFGTYTEANGMEKLSMKDCVDDLKSITGMIRRDFPHIPMFMLGESMGGGLALRVVAEEPDIVDGLICSVPAGSRYKSLLTAIKVGAGFLTDKTKPMPVGVSVVNQATSKEELRKAWLNDPQSRLSITPEELINFQLFMDQNVNFAKQIVDKPVILFQGHDDKLVKESGTLDLFQSLSTPKKCLVLIGDTEHLIFEAGQFKDEITLGVIGWMTAHSPDKKGNSAARQLPARALSAP